jgi:hypothetical protein
VVKTALVTLKLDGLRGVETVFDFSKRVWAARHGVDYIELTGWDPTVIGARQRLVPFQKFQLFRLFDEGYERVLYLDWDTLILQRCPNLLTRLKRPVAVTWDGGGQDRPDPRRQIAPFPEIDGRVAVAPVPFKTHKVQGGFYFFGRGLPPEFQFRRISPELEPYLTAWAGGIDDQRYVTWLLCAHTVDFEVLGPVYNYLPLYHDLDRSGTPEVLKRAARWRRGWPVSNRFSAYVVHYCGLGNDVRLPLAERDWDDLEGGRRPLMFDDLKRFLGWQ